MRRGAVAALVVGVLFALSAVAALACTPRAYLMFGTPLGGTGTPADRPDTQAAFTPGATVTISGYLFEPTAATPVTLRWGVDGPVIAELPVNADGTWTTTFALPADITPGAYILSASAFDAAGRPITGLPARTTLSVVPAAVAPPDDPAPLVRVPAPAVAAATPARADRARPRSAVPAPTSPVAAAPTRPATVATISEVAPPPQTEPASLPTRTHPIRFAPAPRLQLVARAQPVTPAPAARLRVASVARADSAAPPWPALVLGALGVFALGGAGGATLARRSAAPPSGDPVEAALQELLAEERARQIETERARQTDPSKRG